MISETSDFSYRMLMLLIGFGAVALEVVFFAYLGGLFSKKPVKAELKPDINLS